MNNLLKKSSKARHSFENTLKSELTHRRYNRILGLFFYSTLVMLLRAVYDIRSLSLEYFLSFPFMFLLYITFKAFYKSHAETLNLFVVIVSFLVSIAMALGNLYIGFGIFRLTYLIPLSIYFITGNRNHMIASAVVQIILMQTLYASILETQFYSVPMSEIVEDIKLKTCSNLIFLVIILSLVDRDYLQSVSNAFSMESKNKDLEKQKLLLLSFSHELRNLLNGILGQTELAFLEPATSNLRKNLENIKLCSLIMLQEINSALDSTKVEHGELEVNQKPCKIVETIGQAWRICQQMIEKKGLKGKLYIDRLLPKKIIIDEYRLTQIVLNLVGNATKFTETGSVSLQVVWKGDEKEVSEKIFEPIPFEEDGLFEKEENLFFSSSEIETDMTSSPNILDLTAGKGILKLIIRDTGCGIKEHDLKKLFEKFSQIESGKKQMGTGLGLYISKEICEKMGGRIRVFSKEGKGTVFMICLPCEISPVKRSPYSSLSNFFIEKQTTLNGLIVSDKASKIADYQTALNDLGINITEKAKEINDAYYSYLHSFNKKVKIDLMLCDISQSAFKGLMGKIRAFERLKNIEKSTMMIFIGEKKENRFNGWVDDENTVVMEEQVNMKTLECVLSAKGVIN